MKFPRSDRQYDDRWIIYLLIPLSAILTSNLGIEDLHIEATQAYFWPNNIWALVMGYTQYFTSRFIYLKFDHIQPYFKALAIQLIVSLPIVSLCAAFMDFFYVSVLWGYEWPLNSDFLSLELPIIWLWVVILFLIFMVMKLTKAHSTAITTDSGKSVSSAAYVQAFSGNKTLSIGLDEIAYLYVVDKLSLIKTMANDVYRVDKTLNDLESILPDSHFHRANRQLIVNKKAVSGFEVMPTRKLMLELNPPHQKSQFVSKTKITSFKGWLSELG